MSANLSLRMPARLRLAALAALPLLGACDWFTDFKHQPRIEPWESMTQKVADTAIAPRGQPQMAVPVTGTFVAPYQISYTAAPATLDSMGRLLTNPTPPSDASLLNGRKYYNINCAVCHGATGVGNGPTTQNNYGMPSISIISDLTKGRPDGYIYGIIRNGRGLMPTYNRIEEMDRWDVVNYVRALQGQIPNTVGVGPTGYPGQNGATVPGYTVTAPTRPSPFFRDTRSPMGGTGPQTAPVVRAPDEATGASAGETPVPQTQTDSGPRGRINAPTQPQPTSGAQPQTKGGSQ